MSGPLRNVSRIRYSGIRIHILRCSGERSCLYGDVDCESASHDVIILQAYPSSLQDSLRRQSLSLGSSVCSFFISVQAIQWTFPRPQYAFASQARLHGYDPAEAIIEMFPRHGEFTLRESDILDTIVKQGSSIALVIFSGVQYYTGQWFPIKAITDAAKAQVSLRTLYVLLRIHPSPNTDRFGRFR